VDEFVVDEFVVDEFVVDEFVVVVSSGVKSTLSFPKKCIIFSRTVTNNLTI